MRIQMPNSSEILEAVNQGDFYFRQQTAPGIIIIGITTALNCT